MLKYRLTKSGRIERKKLRAKALLCSRVLSRHSQALADAPVLAVKAARKRKAVRSQRIAAKRAKATQPAPFLIGGT